MIYTKHLNESSFATDIKIPTIGKLILYLFLYKKLKMIISEQFTCKSESAMGWNEF